MESKVNTLKFVSQTSQHLLKYALRLDFEYRIAIEKKTVHVLQLASILAFNLALDALQVLPIMYIYKL